MINPRLIVDRTGWFARIFGKRWVAYLRYAVERETREMRYALPMTSMKKRFRTYEEAVSHCEERIVPRVNDEYTSMTGDSFELPRIYVRGDT